jgi:hypothetical protein
VVTAAGFLGLADAPLEARRRELWTGRRKPPMPVRPSRARGLAAGGAADAAERAAINFRPRAGRVREG